MLFNVRNSERDGPTYEITDSRLVPGAYGHAPYASLIAARIRNEGRTDDAASVWYFAGLAETAGWFVYAVVDPPTSPEEEAQIVAFLTEGITYEGPVRDPEWTEEEVETRWAEWVPGLEGGESAAAREGGAHRPLPDHDQQLERQDLRQADGEELRGHPFDSSPSRRCPAAG